MKKLFIIILAVSLCACLFSCASADDLYGTWYVDEGDTRNAIQFSENAEGKDVFVWAVYNIEEDSIESNNTGYYKVSGDTIIFEGGGENNEFELAFELDGDKLTLSSDTASLTLEKFSLD